jgi:hypothetical protein
MVVANDAPVFYAAVVNADSNTQTVSENTALAEETEEDTEPEQFATDPQDVVTEQTGEEVSTEDETVFSADFTPDFLPAGDVKDTDLAKTVVKDTNLLSILAQIIKKDATQASTMTVGDLRGYTKSVDLSSYAADAAKVKSLEGIGCLQNASSFNLLACTAVKTIADSEFQECQMTSIVLPDTIEGIGEYAFYNCKKLESITSGTHSDTLPAGLKSGAVGSNVFNSCISLKRISLSDSDQMSPTAFQYAAGLFRNCTSLREVTVSKNVTILPPSAFTGCGKAAAEGGEGFDLKVEFAAGSQLSTIGNGAFSDCCVETDLTGCKELKVIDKNAFNNVKLAGGKLDLSPCTKLNLFGDGAFLKADIVTILLPESVETRIVLGKEVFAETRSDLCVRRASQTSVNYVKLPAYMKVTADSIGLFRGSAAKHVEIPAEWTSLPEKTFFNAMIENMTIAAKEDGSGELSEIISIGMDAFCQENPKDTGSGTNFKPGTDYLTNVDFLKQCTKLVEIGESAFENCLRIKKVWLSGTVETVGANAFTVTALNKEKKIYESALESFEWENDTKGTKRSLGERALKSRSSLTTVRLPENNFPEEDFVFAEKALHDDIVLKNFSAGANANQVPSHTSSIGTLAFARCMELKTIIVRPVEGIDLKMGDAVFAKCYSLVSAELPATLAVLPKETFYSDCLSSFTMGGEPNVIVSEKLTTLGEFALFGCQMKTLDLSGCPKLKSFDGWTFASVDSKKNSNRVCADENGDGVAKYYSKLQKLILPDELEILSLNAGTFDSALDFSTIVTKSEADKDGVLHIPAYCKGLTGGLGVGEGTFAATSVVPDEQSIPADWKAGFPKGLFEDCDKIQNLDFLKKTNITGLGTYCFADCAGLEKIDLKENTSITTIGEQCFKGCYSLKSDKNAPMTLPASLTTIDKYAFALGAYELKAENTLSKSVLMDSPGFRYVDLSGNTELKDIKVGAFRYNLSLQDAILPKNDKFTQVPESCFRLDESLQTIDLGSATEISKEAFYNCPKLNLKGTSLDLIKKIGSMAFQGDYSLQEVVFGPELQTIEASAFKQCAILTDTSSSNNRRLDPETPDIKFDFSKAAQLKTLGGSAFEEAAMRKIDMNGATALTNIPSNAFRGCSLLEDISFDKHAEYIGSNAMAGCEKLTKFAVYSKTMVDPNVFKEKFLNGVITNTGVSFTVKPYNDVIKVALGQKTDFPYFVNIHTKDTTKTPFSYLVSGDNKKPVADSEKSDMYLKISGDVNGYFINDYKDETNKVDSQFLDKTPCYRTMKNDQEVYVFQVEGLKKASYPFTVGCAVDFNIGDETKEITFFTNYTVEVTDADFAVDLYSSLSNSVLSGLIQPESEILHRSNQRKQLYYDLSYLIDNLDSSTIKERNIKVISADPSIIYPAVTNSDTSGAQSGECTVQIAEADVKAKNKHTFWLVPVKCGTTTLTVYPEAHVGDAKYAHTYDVKIGADLSRVLLRLPNNATKMAIYPEQTAQLELTVSNSFKSNQKLTSFEQYKDYTDGEIVLKTVPEGVISVSENGIIHVNGDVTEAKEVTVSAEYTNTKGEIVTPKENFVTVIVKPSIANEATCHANLYGECKMVDKEYKYDGAIAPGANTFQATDKNLKPTIYYDITYADGADSSAITNHNVTVVSDNPEVMYAGSGSGDRTASATGKTPGVYTTNIQETNTNRQNWKFTLIPVGVGTANITVYPGEHKPGTPQAERFAQTYTYTVNADLRDIRAEMPSDKRTLNPNNTANLVVKVTNCLNQSGTLDTIADLAKYTNNKLTFTSLDTKLLSVDQTGKVKAAKTIKESTSVTVEIKAQTSTDKTITGKVFVRVEPLVVRQNESYVDDTGAAKVKVVTVGSKGTKGEAVYIGPENKTAAAVNIPATVKLGGITYNVTSIEANAFKNNTVVKSVKIPSSVTTIGNNAFSGCKALKKVTIGANVTLIGNNAFAGCTSLKSVVIGKKVKEIGKKAFFNCKSLKKITVKSKVLQKVGKNAFKNIHKKAVIKAPKFEHNLFKKKGQPKSVKIK